MSKGVTDFCLTPIQQVVSYIMDIDQHVELDLYSVSSLKQQSAGRHVAPLEHVIRIRANQSFLFLFNVACLRISIKYQS